MKFTKAYLQEVIKEELVKPRVKKNVNKTASE